MTTRDIKKEIVALEMLEKHKHYNALFRGFQIEWCERFGIKTEALAHKEINMILRNLESKGMVGVNSIPFEGRRYKSYYLASY